METIANITGVETPIYLSSVPYVGNGVPYVPVLEGGFALEEDIDGLMTFGEGRINNENGEYDSLLNAVWSNRAISVLVGDVTWSRANFISVCTGVIEDITSVDQSTVSIKIRDKFQRLNASLSDAALGGGGANANELVPYLFGECFNITPLLTDPAALTYQFNTGTTESLIECRDNALPVSKSTGSGSFTLTYKNFGTVTCSAQGVWPADCASLIKYIVKNFGLAANRFTDADIDLVNFAAFTAANPAAMGIYSRSRDNLLTIVNGLAGSVGARLVMSRAGLLKLVRLSAPAGSPVATVTTADIIDDITLERRTQVKAGVTLNYCKNWTVQKDIKAAIPVDHKDIFAQEWMKITVSNGTVATLYKLPTEAEPVDTYLLDTVSATAEANRRLALESVQHSYYSFTGGEACMGLTVGDTISIVHPRYGMSAGVLAVVVKCSLDAFNLTNKLTVFI
jgi:hypothetical protein